MIVHPDFLEKSIGHFYRQQPPQQPQPGRQKSSLQQVSSYNALADQPGQLQNAADMQRQMEEGRLQRRKLGTGEAAGGLIWVPKPKAAFIQIPQDVYNVDANDPMVGALVVLRSAVHAVLCCNMWITDCWVRDPTCLLPLPCLPVARPPVRLPACLPCFPLLQVHSARFFYGPMLQGRDGIGAAPCCGTGVVFRRDILVSIGGQAYGSITEDYNTAMTLLSAGFATM